MKFCNTKKKEPKRNIFKLIKKKPTVAEVFSKSTSHWRPFFKYSARFSERKGPSTHPQCFSVTETFFGKEMTQNIKGKAADFFGRFYWPAG